MLEGWYCRSMNAEAREKTELEILLEAVTLPLDSLETMTLTTDTVEADHETMTIPTDTVVAEHETITIPTNTVEAEHETITIPTDTAENDNDSTDAENNSEVEPAVPVNAENSEIDYKALFHDLKPQFHQLIFDSVYFKNKLRTSQQRLLKVTRDRAFLLDRLLEYEHPLLTSSDSDETDSSDDSCKQETLPKKRKIDASAAKRNAPPKPNPAQTRRTKKETIKQLPQSVPLMQLDTSQEMFQNESFVSQQLELSTISFQSNLSTASSTLQSIADLLTAPMSSNLFTAPAQCDATSQEFQLSKEEIERHLQSRRTMPEVVPEGELPTEMFNNNSFMSIDEIGETSSGGMLNG